MWFAFIVYGFLCFSFYFVAATAAFRTVPADAVKRNLTTQRTREEEKKQEMIF